VEDWRKGCRLQLYPRRFSSGGERLLLRSNNLQVSYFMSFLNLKFNHLVYSRLKSKIVEATLAEKGKEEILHRIETCAWFAYHNHVGMFSDGVLENIAFRIGANLDNLDSCDIDTNIRLEDLTGGTLHVVSNVYKSGGHSRMLAKWISRDKSTKHIVVFTREQSALPDFFARSLNEHSVKVIYLGNRKGIIERSLSLRTIAKRVNRVILHTHPDDVVPIVAFAHSDSIPPVALFNHAHFWYCLGSTIADSYINTHVYYRNLSAKQRFARRAELLCTVGYGLSIFQDVPVNKSEAKSSLGIEDGQIVLLAMATEQYFKPAFGYDFFKTSQRILDSFSNIRIVFVGLSGDSKLIPKRLKNNPRVYYLGVMADPSLAYKAADVCLESFPIPSLGAVTQSVIVGEAFPVLMYGVGENIARIDRTEHFSGVYRAKSEREYLSYVSELIANPKKTREAAKRMRKNLIEKDALFEEKLVSLYEHIDNHEHKPRLIPPGCFHYAEDNLFLSAQSKPFIDRIRILLRNIDICSAG